MTYRISCLKSIAIAAIGAISLLVLMAGPAEARATKVFDGEGLSVKPAQLSGWTSFGGDSSDPVYVAGRSGNLKDGVGPIEWTSWGKRKAVGIGRGYTVNCPGVDCVPAPVNPWDGTKVRVTAYGKRDGSFKFLKVFQWTAWMEGGDFSDSALPKGTGPDRENYTMKLKFRGDKWTVVSIDDGRS
ncbi:MAG: hypothetical protein ACSLFD_09420 [Solirubrobacterales bacterium]